MARILVIDDEKNIRAMVGLALKQEGHSVDLAEDGRSGLNAFEEGSGFDLVLLDQRMPELDGLEVLHEMRRRKPDARVVMITAFGTIDLAVDAMKSGAADFLRKPFTVETLRGSVTAALRSPAPPPSAPSSTTFGFKTLNGFAIESQPDHVAAEDGGLRFSFTLRSPAGDVSRCDVTLSPRAMDAVKAHLGCDQPPGGDRYWHALSEHVVADHVWQNATFPPQSLSVDELSQSIRNWVDAVAYA
jgi:DNA-binding response OmpR family regulator